MPNSCYEQQLLKKSDDTEEQIVLRISINFYIAILLLRKAGGC